MSHGPTLQVLGLRLGLGFRVFIISFKMCHMVAQQLLDLIPNATAGPWHATFVIVSFKVKVCHYSYMSTRLVALTTASPILGFLTHLHLF